MLSRDRESGRKGRGVSGCNQAGNFFSHDDKGEASSSPTIGTSTEAPQRGVKIERSTAGVSNSSAANEANAISDSNISYTRAVVVDSPRPLPPRYELRLPWLKELSCLRE